MLWRAKLDALGEARYKEPRHQNKQHRPYYRGGWYRPNGTASPRFPETWRSWKRQIQLLAEAGFRPIAPDMRGYGGSSIPAGASAFSQPHIVGDLVPLLDGLEIENAVIAGHDWGSIGNSQLYSAGLPEIVITLGFWRIACKPY